ncbi:Transmembrane protein 145 [Lamellibrachia satsuma]|nr:Transmembrane protein 145 [Lamellibrachia satsuma]
MDKSLYILLVFYLWLLPTETDSKYVEGELTQTDEIKQWVFLDRFCFLSDKGELVFDFIFPKEYEGQHLLLYYDEQSSQWPAVYKKDKTCSEKESPPHIRPTSNQMIVLSREHYWSGCKLLNRSSGSNEDWITCHASRGFKSSRARWWYIALSRCANDSKGLRLKYQLTMTNAPEGQTFFRQFSADEFYILQTDIGFLVAMFCIFLLSCYVGVILRSRQLFHTTYKMYIVSLTLEVLHLFFMCIAYGKYANDGRNNYGMKTFARTLEAASTLTFLLMLILMAKGYTITRGRLSSSGSMKIAVFMTLYTIAYIALFIYEAKAFDPGLVLYIYESPAGYGLIAMRLIGWAWFCYAIFFTLKHYPEKSSFYYPYFLFYTAWFWAGPIVIFIAMSYMELWVREKVVNGVMNAVVLVGHLFFLPAVVAQKHVSSFTEPFEIGVKKQWMTCN